MTNKGTIYRSVDRLDLYSAKNHFIHYMNKFALIAVLVFSAIGLTVSYVTRIPGEPGGKYLINCLLSVPLCVVYIYVHEYVHALAILMIKQERPRIKFDKLIASCGSNTIVFSKAEYFFVAGFPFMFFCAALIPVCVLIPAMYFPLAFSPLMYNLFGSAGDFYMIRRAMMLPRGGVVIDKGSEVVLYVPENK